MELRQTGLLEIVEVPMTGAVGGLSTLDQISKTYQVDAVFSGSVDETQGTLIHVRLHDAATGEVIWSATYLLGTGMEFFSLSTPQQRFQHVFQLLTQRFAKQYALSFPPPSGRSVGLKTRPFSQS
jgi:hypothetical protein